MHSQVMRFAIAPFMALLAMLGIVAAPAWAGEDRGMCKADDSRVHIPSDFPVAICFDGKTLVLKNDTQFPLKLTLTGNGVGKPQLYSQGEVDGASLVLATFDPNVVPPGYHTKVDVGNAQVSVHLGTADARAQKAYLIAESIWRYVPVGEAAKSVVDFVNELMQVGDNYLTCRGRSKHTWDDVLCSARLGWDVEFAAGRAVVKGLVGAVVKSIISLIETAKWADAASGDLLSLKNGTRDFTIQAYTPPAPPTTTKAPAPQPPAPNPGNGGSGGGGNPAPPPVNQPPPPAATLMATVQNMHLVGSNGLAEDSTPAYLSASTQPYCASRGCKIDGTEMWSGATFVASCWTDGDFMTNQNASIPDDDNNPNRLDTTRWLEGSANGKTGFISFIYITPASRGLVGHC